MREADITRPRKAARNCAQLAIVLSDNARAGSLPATPSLRISAVLLVAVLQWAVLVVLLPFVLLLLGPAQRTTVRCTRLSLSQLLACDAARMSDVAMQRRVPQGPIALVKVDVEGAEWEVLRRFTAAARQRLEQIFMGMHDVDNRVKCVEQLLCQQGFVDVRTSQDDWASHTVLRIHPAFTTRNVSVAQTH